MGNTTYIYNNTLADGKINESTAANKLINKREASKMNDCLIFDTYIEKIQMPLCSYILFIVSSVFTKQALSIIAHATKIDPALIQKAQQLLKTYTA